MAKTQLQNSQRIIILMQLFSIVSIVTFLTIKLIKKKIDINPKVDKEEQQSESAAQKYKQNEITQHQFQTKVVKSTTLTDDDTCTQRLMKKICEYNVYFSPMFILLSLSFITGRSKAFAIASYFISLISCFLFNVFKVHRACVQQKTSRFFIEIIWVVFNFLILLDIILHDPSNMMYNVIQG